MGHSINMVNTKRYELFKPDLNDQFKQLCGSHTPVTKLLFRDDLSKPVKEASKTNEEGVRVSSKLKTYYDKQQKRANFSHRTHHQSPKPLLWKWPIRGQERDYIWISRRRAKQIKTNFCQTSRPTTFSGESENNVDHSRSVIVPHVAGRLKQFVAVWQTITSDYCILISIKGVKIEFLNYPKQTMIPREYNFDATEVVIIDKQVETFLQTVIEAKNTLWRRVYISNIFIRPKKDGLYRLILNLKSLNQFVSIPPFQNGKP